LRSHNKSDDQFASAVDNFILSCGKGMFWEPMANFQLDTVSLPTFSESEIDITSNKNSRYKISNINSNIMVTQDGRLFHIDFGHFLGNFKTKFGFKRERAPFVLTPDMAYVMGGRESEGWIKFVNLCCVAYNMLRKHANVFINLFAMVTPWALCVFDC
jgi:hypothetical protein